MVGSTELSERLDPEDLGDLLNSYQRVCRDAIVRHGGHVSQYLGDGVLAYFGYPVAHGDDAERAIRASLSILETIKLTNQGIGKRLHEEVHVRVGLHTGVVVIAGGVGGGIERLAVGESVNLAARIQTIAPVRYRARVGHYRAVGGRLFRSRVTQGSDTEGLFQTGRAVSRGQAHWRANQVGGSCAH